MDESVSRGRIAVGRRLRRAARTRSCRCRPSGPRGRRRAPCSACSRSTRSRGRAARCTGSPRSRMYAQHVVVASSRRAGSPSTARARSSQPSFGASARVGDWSRRTPVIQPSRSPSARPSGSTLRIAQQRSGLRSQSASPCVAACRPSDGPSNTSIVVPYRCSTSRQSVVGLGEEDVGVEREDARLRLDAEAACRAAPSPPSGTSRPGKRGRRSARPSPRPAPPPRAPRSARRERRRRRGRRSSSRQGWYQRGRPIHNCY